MALSIDIGEIIEIIRETETDPIKQRELIEKINAAEKQAKIERDAEKDDVKVAKAKSRFVVLIRGTDEIKKLLPDRALLVAIPEDDDGKNVIKTLQSATARHNDTVSTKRNKTGRGRPGKNLIINSWMELVRWIKPATLKEFPGSVKIKSKEPIEVQVLLTEDVNPKGN